MPPGPGSRTRPASSCATASGSRGSGSARRRRSPASGRSSSRPPGRSSTAGSGRRRCPYLARYFRVLTWDGRGNGRSDRPTDPAAYTDATFAEDGLAVLDANDTPSAVVVGLSYGARWTLLLAADHPERVDGAVFIGASLPYLSPAGSAHVGDGLPRGPRRVRGLGPLQRALVAAGLRRVRRVLLPPVLHGAPLDEADRGLHRVGARDRPRDADPDGDDDRASTTGRRSRRSRRGCAARRS